MGRHSVGSTQDFEPQKVKVLRVGGERIGVVFHEGKYYAWEDRCTHDDGPLGQGPLEGCQIECPRHGARFDIRTGRVMAPPAFTPLEIYQTEVDQDQVYVEIPD
ncbi:hypothetical protein ABS71_06750 [bacterium SCN 62-11]|nr:non-heme iron oxygenase ferredoxin subunit [Candidatus Eremiobacteraeota bacterium]ODT73680.1 MAG: hypothetical protein ABS71_06750 [bacterium SCN 62-11]